MTIKEERQYHLKYEPIDDSGVRRHCRERTITELGSLMGMRGAKWPRDIPHH